MKAQEINNLESYFKTENEHWNEYAFELLCEVLEQGQFENPETPLQLLSKAVDIFTEQHETPLRAVQKFGGEVNKQNLNPSQKLFVYEWVLKYVKYSEFEKADTDEIKDILKSQTARLENEVKNQKPEYNKPLVGNIRDTLKELLQNELKQLPETFKDLEPMQRLNILCKLIPYVLPKVQAVHSESGEPESKTSNQAFHNNYVL